MISFHNETTQQEISKDLLRLSKMPEKRKVFSTDVYFREAWIQAKQHWDGATKAAEVLSSHASLIIKPECILGGTAPLAIRLVLNKGFHPLLMHPFRFNRFNAREQWRYWLTNATMERLQAMTDFLALSESLFVVVRDDLRKDGVPGTVRLAEAKGAADLDERDAGTIRDMVSVLPHPLLTALHTADEPADMIREFGVLFDPQERMRIFQALDSAATPDVEGILAELGVRNPPREMRLEVLIQRIIDLCERYMTWMTGQRQEMEKLIAILRRVMDGEQGLWPTVEGMLDSYGIPLGREDRIVIAVTSCRPFVNDRTHTFPRQGPAVWCRDYDE